MRSAYDLPEWSGFLAAIKANPDDDLPRKVAADWLQEHGEDERAEFVRVQCEIAKCGPTPILLHRENELFYPGVGVWESFRDRYPEFVILTPSQCKPGHYTGGQHLTIARGFVSRVSGPLAALVGGRCRHCEGGYFGYPRTGTPDCPVCDATGWSVKGVLRRLVRREPVAEVVVSDRQPWRVAGGVGRWGWSKHPDDMMFTGNRSVIPAEILDLIPEADDSPMRGFRHRRWFRTADAARSALSTACLAWAARPEEVPA